MNAYQRDLFEFNNDICANRHGGNEFSVAANPPAIQKSRDRLRIILYIRDHGPRSAEEIEQELRMRRSTVSARMSELKRDGLIKKVGRCETSTGATAGVYGVAA